MDSPPPCSQIPDYGRLCRLSKAYPALDPDLVRAVAAVRDVGALLGSAVAESLASFDVSEGRMRALGVLLIEGRALSPSELAESMGVTRATTTGLVSQLETQGLVRRLDDPRDRRRVSVELTDAGRAFADRVLPRHLARIAHLLDGLERDELRTLVDLLHRVESAVLRARETDA